MNRKLLTGILAIALICACAGVGTMAYFTSRVESGDNVFTTGTLVIDSPGALTAEMDVDNIYPGWFEDKDITVKNSGTIPLKYRISVQPLTGNIFYDGKKPLQIGIVKPTDPPTKLPKLGRIDWMKPVEIGTIPAGGSSTFNITFYLPKEANNDYQGKSATFTFVFDATQTANQGWAE